MRSGDHVRRSGRPSIVARPEDEGCNTADDAERGTNTQHEDESKRFTQDATKREADDTGQALNRRRCTKHPPSVGVGRLLLHDREAAGAAGYSRNASSDHPSHADEYRWIT